MSLQSEILMPPLVTSNPTHYFAVCSVIFALKSTGIITHRQLIIHVLNAITNMDDTIIITSKIRVFYNNLLYADNNWKHMAFEFYNKIEIENDINDYIDKDC